MSELNPPVVGTPRVGFSYRAGRCSKCGIAIIKEINPPESLSVDLATYAYVEQDVCGICQRGKGATVNPRGNK